MNRSTERQTNQRMPGRSAAVVGAELGNGPVGATPTAKPQGAPQPPPPKRPLVKGTPKGPAQN